MKKSHSNALEVESILKSFEIIVDTRERSTPNSEHRYKAFGVPYSRATLRYGDYAANITLDNGEKLYDTSKVIYPSCVIERKMSLDELAMCFTRSRDRFQREFERARDNNASIILVCENGSYDKILSHKYNSRFNPDAFMGSITAWSFRYGLKIVFCSSLMSGRIIKEFLYRDIKERLERGDYVG